DFTGRSGFGRAHDATHPALSGVNYFSRSCCVTRECYRIFRCRRDAARSAARQAEGDSPPGSSVFGLKEGDRGDGKVGNLILVFHFSIRPRRRNWGNVGISPGFGEISKGLVERVGSL